MNDRMNDRMTNRLRGGAAVIAVEGTERSQQDARLRVAWLAFRARNQALTFGSLSNELLAGSSWLALARVSGLNLGLNSSLNLGLNPG